MERLQRFQSIFRDKTKIQSIIPAEIDIENKNSFRIRTIRYESFL